MVLKSGVNVRLPMNRSDLPSSALARAPFEDWLTVVPVLKYICSENSELRETSLRAVVKCGISSDLNDLCQPSTYK